jgi:aspartyl-tRNA(Asn)/glutamyl-tRNA(Gln) amidotransferase subunit C
MRLTREEVEHIAALARLALTDAEKQQYAEQLSDILDYAAILEAIETDHIPPTASVLDMALRLREDEARPGLTRDVLLSNASKTRDGQFKVPPVLGNQHA